MTEDDATSNTLVSRKGKTSATLETPAVKYDLAERERLVIFSLVTISSVAKYKTVPDTAVNNARIKITRISDLQNLLVFGDSLELGNNDEEKDAGDDAPHHIGSLSPLLLLI